MNEMPKPLEKPAVIRQWIPKKAPTPRGHAPARPGVPLLRVDRVVIGDTGWPGLTAREAAKDLGQAFGHFLVDDVDIIECVPVVTSGVGLLEQARFVEFRPPLGDAQGSGARGSEYGLLSTSVIQESSLFMNLCFGGRMGLETAYKQWVGLAAYLCHRFMPETLAVEEFAMPAAKFDRARQDPNDALGWAKRDFAGFLKSVAGRLNSAKSEMPLEPAAPGGDEPGLLPKAQMAHEQAS